MRNEPRPELAQKMGYALSSIQVAIIQFDSVLTATTLEEARKMATFGKLLAEDAKRRAREVTIALDDYSYVEEN